MKKNFLFLSLLVLGLGLSLTIVAKVKAASDSSQANITFPVPELGNCASQDACKAYCNDTSHMQACVKFAQSHGLINQSQASQGELFAKTLANGGGPGGCDSPDSCQTYCSAIDHLEACLSFAKSHGLNNNQMADGEKILAYLKSGGTMPGGCNSQTSCQGYCDELSHIAACSAFVEKAGLTPPGGGPQQLTLVQIQKLAALAQSGQTPGGCATNESCRSYCDNPDHAEACQAFATAVGFSGPGSAPGGQGQPHLGPGGCNSPESCQAYCGDSSHQDECLKFAGNSGGPNQGSSSQGVNGNGSPNGRPEQTVGEILKNAPPEIVACIKNKLGGNLPDYSSPADQNFGQSIKGCFDSYRPTPQQNNQPNIQPNGQENRMPPVNGTGQIPFQGQGMNNGGPNQQFPPMSSSSAPFNQSGPMPNQIPQSQPMPGSENQPQPNQPAPMMPLQPQGPASGSPMPPPPLGTQSQPTQPASFNSTHSLLGSLLAPIESLIGR